MFVRSSIKRRGLVLVHPRTAEESSSDARTRSRLDHHNYARWLPVHIRDMMLLEECNSDVAAEFKKGIIVVKKLSMPSLKYHSIMPTNKTTSLLRVMVKQLELQKNPHSYSDGWYLAQK